MKRNIFSIVLVLSVFTLQAVAQDQKPAPATNKGYYSFGNHEKNLPAMKRPLAEARLLETHPTVTKGYYSMKGHNTKLPKQTVVIGRGPLGAPAKGFYSIR